MKRGTVLCLVLVFAADVARADPARGGPGSVLDMRAASPAAGFALTGRGGGLERGAPPGAFRLGFALEGAFVPEDTRHPLVHQFAVGPRAELALSRTTSAWFGVALEKRQQDDAAWTAPVLETGVHTALGAFDARAGVRHVVRQRPQGPVQVWSWTSPPYFQSPPDTIPTLPYWVQSPAEPVSVTAFELGADWATTHWGLEGTGGVAVGSGFAPVPLAAVRAVRWVRADVGVVLGMRAAVPAWLATDFDDHRRVELGLRFAPGRSARDVPEAVAAPPPEEEPAWQALRRGPGLYALRVSAPSAGRVALRGDFTAWQPIELALVDDGWWEGVVNLPAGLHEVEIAVDGRDWQPPPGALTTQGTYGQTVGLLVAE